MKKLSTTPISSTVLFPIKSGTLDFIQLAYQEAVTALVNSKVGITYYSGTAYILYGLRSYISGGNTVIQAGAIFFNEEVFLFGGQTIPTPAGPNVIVCNIATTQYTTNADPVTFSDASVHDVHNIRQIAFSSGTSGSGNVADFSDFVGGYAPYLSSGPGGITFAVSPATWSNFGSPYWDAGVKIYDNKIDLCGVVQATLPALGNFNILTINAGNFDIVNDIRIPVVIQETSTYIQTTLTLTTTGVLSVDVPGAGDYVVYLDGITFRIS